MSYLQTPTTTNSGPVSDVVHYSATGTVLGSFLVDAFASPEALSTGGFSLSEAGFGGTSTPNAVIATYVETATTPSSSTTVATAAAGQEIVAVSLPTTAGAVGEVVTIAEASGQTSSLDLTVPGATTPLVFSAPAADSATTSYYVLPTNIVAASDGSFYTAITTFTETGATSAESIAVYDIISGAPQLLTTIAPPSTFLSSPSIALLSNGDIAVEYSGAQQTTSGGEAGFEQYVELLSPTGAQIGPTLSLGVGPAGDALSVLSNGDLATLVYGSSGLFVQQLGLGGALPPTLTITSAGGPTNQATQVISGTIDAADAGLTVSLYDGSTLLGTVTPLTSGAWSNSITLPTQGANVITAQATNAASELGTSNSITYTLDTTAPTASSLTDVTSNGTVLTAGETMTFTLDASTALNVAAGANLTLSNGATAVYTGGSGTNVLNFTYTVAAGDAATADLQVFGYTGSITDAYGNPLVEPGVSENTGVQIGATAPTAKAVNYSFTTFSIPGDPEPTGFVASTGEIVGNYYDPGLNAGSGPFYGFTDINGVFATLDPGGFGYTSISGVDPAGEIVGTSEYAAGTSGFTDNNGVIATISVPGSTYTSIAGVTAAGELFGTYTDSSGDQHGFIDNNGAFTTIDPPGASGQVAFLDVAFAGEITDAYVFAGSYSDSSGEHAFVDNNGVFATINPPGATGGFGPASGVLVSGVDAAGEVVGDYSNSNSPSSVAGFIYNNGTSTALDIPGATETGISGITTAGEIFGVSGSALGAQAFADNNSSITTINLPGGSSDGFAITQVTPSGDLLGGTYSSATNTWSGFFGVPASNQAMDNFNGDGASDLLLENTSGAVAVGAIGGNGQESYTQVAALGPEWSFQGNGDFLGNGQAQFLIENTSGAVDVGNVVNGQAQYTQVATLGPEWTFQGTGDFLGNGQDQFLIENTSGAVDVGNVVNGQAQYTQVAALGPEWTFEGTGDFLGNGQDQFLIENTSGAVDVGNVVNGQAQYTQVAALGPEWTFEGTGDFLGNGQDQFLVENTSGAVDVGNVVNGQVQYTQVAALGPEWSFIGTGDYQGTGTAGFMIENTAGAVELGTISNGQASYSQVGALGPEWSSHSSHA